MMAPGTLVRATGTLTLLDIVVTDVFVVGGITYLDIATPIAAYDFDDASDDTGTAVNMALAINATGVGVATTYYETGTLENPSVFAASAGLVVTVTARLPGLLGNGIILNSVDSTITASGDTVGDTIAGVGNLDDALESLLDEVQLNSEAISLIAHLTSRTSDD